MTVKSKTTGSLAAFVVISLFCHILCGYLAGMFGPLDLTKPVAPASVIGVTLESPIADPPPPVVKVAKMTEAKHSKAIKSPVKINSHTMSDKLLKCRNSSSSVDQPSVATKPVQTPSPQKITEHKVVNSIAIKSENTDSHNAISASTPITEQYEIAKAPLRSGDEFVPNTREKLTYRIMLFGIPAGTAVLEAKNSNGEMRITTRVWSNDVFSSFYPVDISVDTRLMVGNYLLTRIRQHEGNSTSDTGFTLMLREKNAFWVDRLKKRYANIPLPSNDVMDMISGFYYLRNQRLEVGKSVVLHLFDSSKYTETTVEVLRKEHLRLPGFREADTLVVHPILKTDGFFHSSGEIFVWLTDDEKKVPVKVEAEIPLGKVTAELVSAESSEESENEVQSQERPGADVRKTARPENESSF